MKPNVFVFVFLWIIGSLSLMAEIEIRLAVEKGILSCRLYKVSMVNNQNEFCHYGLLTLEVIADRKKLHELAWVGFQFPLPGDKTSPWIPSSVTVLSRGRYLLQGKMNQEQTQIFHTLLRRHVWPSGMNLRMVYRCYEERKPDTIRFIAREKKLLQGLQPGDMILAGELKRRIDDLAKEEEALSSTIAREAFFSYLRSNYFTYSFIEDELKLVYRGEAQENKHILLASPFCVERETQRCLFAPTEARIDSLCRELNYNISQTTGFLRIAFLAHSSFFEIHKAKAIQIFPEQQTQGKKMPGIPIYLDKNKDTAIWQIPWSPAILPVLSYRLRIYKTDKKIQESGPHKVGGEEGIYSVPEHVEILTPPDLPSEEEKE